MAGIDNAVTGDLKLPDRGLDTPRKWTVNVAQGPGMSGKLRAYFEERLPRYTSYPTEPNFAPEVGLATYGQWLSELPVNVPSSLYLHIPLCRSMC